MYAFSSFVFLVQISIFVCLASREMFAREMVLTFCKGELKNYDMSDNTQFLDYCQRNSEPFFHAIDGFKKGLTHCQEDFRCHRWNCTTDQDHGFKLFGTGMARGIKKLFFIYYCFYCCFCFVFQKIKI